MKVFLTRRISGEGIKILQTSGVYARFFFFLLIVISHLVAKIVISNTLRVLVDVLFTQLDLYGCGVRLN